MQIHFSDVFDIDPEQLEEYGAFNISVINDLPLFIDPFLLFNSKDPVYQNLHEEIIGYLRFLKDVSESRQINQGLLKSWFIFPEVKQNWLGYSLVGNQGSGLGLDFAKTLHQNLYTIFNNFGEENVTRGSHLEKLCLIKDGVGRDNISDFTTNLIKGYLLKYTEDFALQHISSRLLKRVMVDHVTFNYYTQTWERDFFNLPFFNSDFVLLTPKDILTKDETWINKSDLVSDFPEIARAIPNEQLRAQVNDYFRRMLPKDPKRKDIREAVGSVIRQFPQFLDHYIRYKEERGDDAKNLSEQQVKEVETIFIHQLREFVEKLIKHTGFYNAAGGTYQEVKARVMFLKDVIENKGGHRLFYANGMPIRREEDLQILFRFTWFASPLDVSREVNDGRGPVDFKVSQRF